MKVGKLRLILEGLDDDVDVMVAAQPNWPLQYFAGTAIVVDSNQEAIDELQDALYGPDLTDDERDQAKAQIAKLEAENKTRLYISEGGSVYSDPYCPASVVSALGWR